MPKLWRTLPLAEIATEIRERTKDPSVYEGPYIGFEHLEPGSLRLGHLGSAADVSSTKTVFGLGDVLFGKLRPYLRKVALADCDGICSTDILVLRARAETVTPYFLALLLSSDDVFQHAVATSVGTRMPRTSFKALGTLPVPVPPLAEQRRIVDLARTLDDVALAVLRTHDAALAASPAALASAAADSPSVPLSKLVAKAKAGATPSRRRPDFFEGSIPWLKSAEVDNPLIVSTEESITEEALSACSTWVAPEGSVVVAMYGATAGMVGRLAAPVAMNQAVLALVADPDKVDERYLYHWMKSRTANMKARTAGGVQPNLSKDLVLEEPVPVPPLPVQRSIADLLDSLVALAASCDSEAREIRTLRDAILADLLGGGHLVPPTYDRLLVSA